MQLIKAMCRTHWQSINICIAFSDLRLFIHDFGYRLSSEKEHSIGLDTRNTRKQMKGLFYRYVLRKNTVCMVAEKWSNLMADDKPEVSLHLHNVFQ